MPSRLIPLLALAACLSACGHHDKSADKAIDLGALEKNREAAAPCNQSGTERLPVPPEPPIPVHPGISSKARRDEVNGCAGIRFRIARDGTTRDAQLVIEAPTGYGFGQAALAALADTAYDPRTVKAEWFYFNYVFIQQRPGQKHPPG